MGTITAKEKKLIWGRCRRDVKPGGSVHNFIEQGRSKRRKCRGTHGGHGHMLYQIHDWDINDPNTCPVCLQMLRDEGVLPKIDEPEGQKKKAEV